MKASFVTVICVAAISLMTGAPVRADVTQNQSFAVDTRYGPLGAFDSRSSYGKGIFPEPFVVDDSDLEVNEFRLDYLHGESPGSQQNQATAELEKGFGLITLEIEAPYVYNTSRSFDAMSHRSSYFREQGFGNIDLGARAPFFQYVSPHEFFDTTFGVGIEVGIPTNSPVSKNAELVPKIFNDTRIGDHLTIQSILGYSWLLGSQPDGGSRTFEYGFDFGWTIYHHELPIPSVEQFVPIFELSGETQLTHPGVGITNLTGLAGARFNLRPIGGIQPRLGIGYVFPLNGTARQDLHWGIVTSFVFEW